MKIYKANRKGLIRYLLAIFLILPFAVFWLDPQTFREKPFILLPLIIPGVLFLWIYFDTSYRIESGKLKYKSGFLKGEIEIKAIREITKETTKWSGLRPALAKKGIIIRYNRFDDLYIAPESNDALISDLLKLNDQIKITG